MAKALTDTSYGVPATVWQKSESTQHNTTQTHTENVMMIKLFHHSLKESMNILVARAESEYFFREAVSAVSTLFWTYCMSSTSYPAMDSLASRGSFQLMAALVSEMTTIFRFCTTLGPVENPIRHKYKTTQAAQSFILFYHYFFCFFTGHISFTHKTLPELCQLWSWHNCCWWMLRAHLCSPDRCICQRVLPQIYQTPVPG